MWEVSMQATNSRTVLPKHHGKHQPERHAARQHEHRQAVARGCVHPPDRQGTARLRSV
ncbi:MAG: hypothetical protein MZV64_59565 [Ignavibacteriales bacterium]|nr:hypothetical protein [Ignavibacteriales bacterium]